MERHLITGLALLAAAALFASCEKGSTAPDWLVRYTGELNGNDAGIGGTLTREGNCLYVSDSELRFFMVFPEDTSFDEDTATLTVLGHDFEVGGGFEAGGNGEEGSVLAQLDLTVQPDPSCDTSQIWIVGDL